MAVAGAVGLTALAAGGSAIDDHQQGVQAAAHWADPTRKHDAARRVAGLYANPNLLGLYLALALPWCLALARTTDPGPRILGWVAAAAAGAGLALSYSRSGWIAAAAGVAGLAFLLRGRARLGGGLAAALLAGLLVAPGLHERVQSLGRQGEFGVVQRWGILRGVVETISAAPLLGHGAGAFPLAYPIHRVQGGQYPLTAHCQVLEVAVETGVPGVALLLLLLASAGRAWRRARDLEAEQARRGGADDEPDPWRAAAAASFLAGAAGSLFESPLHYSSVATLLVLSLGLAAGPPRRARRATGDDPGTGADRQGRGKATSVILALFAGWGALVPALVAPAQELRAMVRSGVRGIRGLDAGAELRASVVRELVPGLAALIDRAESLDPGAPVDLYLRGDLLLAIGDPVRAERAFLGALGREARESLVWAGVARARQAQGADQAALEAYDRALALDPYGEAWMLERARVLRRLGHLEEAALVLEGALQTNPGLLRVNHETYPAIARELVDLREAQGLEEEADQLRAWAAQQGL